VLTGSPATETKRMTSVLSVALVRRRVQKLDHAVIDASELPRFGHRLPIPHFAIA
jgi:hypothetical protein